MSASRREQSSSAARRRRRRDREDSTPPDKLPDPALLSQPSRANRWRGLLICLALIIATVAAYWPIRHNGFVDFDDPGYVTSNRHVLGGLKAFEVRWVFTHFCFYNYHPITFLSHMLDVQMFGLNAAGHHATSVALHALNGVLLFLLLRGMTGATFRSAFVAGAFALHPQHVESVAWVAERKDVLSTLFWFLAMLAYLAYVRRPTWWRYLLVVLCMTLGLLCKPMLVTLPLVLLLMDYWPLQRDVSWRRRVIEKVPLLALSTASCVLTVLAQEVAVASVSQLPLLVRLSLIPLAYARYCIKMLWPAQLAVLYPIPTHIGLLPVGLSLLALIVVTILAFKSRRRTPYFIVGWLWFLGTLVPVIGIVQVGAQSMADRYTYVPLIGLFVAGSWGAWDLVRRFTSTRSASAVPAWANAALALSALFLLLAWGTVTRGQIRYWRDSNALFERAVQVEPRNPIILANVGWELARSGNPTEAIPYYLRALQIAKFPDVYSNLGLALASEGSINDAVRIMDEGVARFPHDSVLLRSAGVVYNQKGDLQRAQKCLAESVRINPSDVVARQLLAGIYLHLNQDQQAQDQTKEVLAAMPDDPDSVYNVASVLSARGKTQEAVEQFRKYLTLRPDDPDGHFRLALSLTRLGQTEESLTELRTTLRLNPNHGGAMNNLAWTLATHPEAGFRNGAEAVQLAERASRLPRSQTSQMLDTLAAAYAEAGNFAQAILTADHAADLAEQQHSPDAPVIRQRAQRYRQGKPFRDQSKP